MFFHCAGGGKNDLQTPADDTTGQEFFYHTCSIDKMTFFIPQKIVYWKV